MVIVEGGGVVARHTELRQDAQVVGIGSESGPVRYLVCPVVAAELETHFGVGIEQVGKVAEAFFLLRHVMYRIAAGGRILNADIVAQVGAVDEIAQFVVGAAVFKTGVESLIAAAVHIDVPAGRKIGFGIDLDHPRRAITILCGERAGEQVDVLREACVQCLAEPVDAFRKHHAVDTVLDVAMIAPDMDLSERVIDHTGGLEQHFVQRGVFSLRQVFDVFFAEAIDAAAGLGRQTVACVFQPGHRDIDIACLSICRLALQLGRRNVVCGGSTQGMGQQRGNRHAQIFFLEHLLLRLSMQKPSRDESKRSLSDLCGIGWRARRVGVADVGAEAGCGVQDGSGEIRDRAELYRMRA